MSGQKLILKLSTSHLKLITSVNKLAISTTEPSTHINMEFSYVNLKSPRFLSIPGEMEDGDVQCIDTYRQHLLLFGLMTSLLSDPQIHNFSRHASHQGMISRQRALQCLMPGEDKMGNLLICECWNRSSVQRMAFQSKKETMLFFGLEMQT